MKLTSKEFSYCEVAQEVASTIKLLCFSAYWLIVLLHRGYQNFFRLAFEMSEYKTERAVSYMEVTSTA